MKTNLPDFNNSSVPAKKSAFFRQNVKSIKLALNIFCQHNFSVMLIFWPPCFCSQDYHRNKGCTYHIKNIILNTSVEEVHPNHFLKSKFSISMHSVSIGICIKKATKSLLFCPLKGLRGCPNVLKCIIDTGAQRSCIGKKAFVRLGGDPDILSKSTHLYIFGDGKPWPSIGKTKIVSRDVPGHIRQ